ncbi:MAG TPA: DUF6064 family protein [Gemmatimonadaceae bacterium]|nr:DUF6064 family protein [Gemmatimonadaceae bacterium]
MSAVQLPFTSDEFFAVFRRYNEAVWPAQWLLNALAVAVVVLAVRGASRRRRVAGALVAFLWFWAAMVYHAGFFVAINTAALLFAALFVAESGLLAVATYGRALTFRVRADARGIAGGALVAYALVGYPLLGYVLGQRYPEMPTFGAPCPTTIFTFGVLLWTARPVPRVLLVVPALWAAIGSVAALQLGVREDYGLAVAAAVALPLLLKQPRPGWRSLGGRHVPRPA